MKKELIIDWINNFINYAIIVFLFIKAVILGALDSFDIFITISGLIISVVILTIRIITK